MIKEFASLLSALMIGFLTVCTVLVWLAPFVEVGFLPWVQLLGAGVIPLAIVWAGTLVWTLRKKRYVYSLLSVGALLLCGMIALKDYQWRAITAEKQNGLTVLSYNLGAFDFREAKVDSAVILLKALQPDVMCFQEFRNHENRQGQKAMQYMSETLEMPYYAFVHLPFHVHGAAIFSRYPIQKMDTLYLPRAEINSGIMATIEGPQGKIGVANLHISSFHLSQTLEKHSRWQDRFWAIKDQSEQVLKRQQEKVDQVLTALERYPHPFVVCGDFNAPPHSRITSQFSQRYQDSFLAKGQGPGWTFPVLGRMGIRIDYQFYSNELNVQSHQVIPSEVSDHYPILASYTLMP